MNAINHIVRETAAEARPEPHGGFDGVTRAQAMAALLLKHEAGRRPAAAWGLAKVRRRVERMLGLAAATALALQIVASFPRLPPAEAAAIVARIDSPANRTGRRAAAAAPAYGPTFFVTRVDAPPPAPARRLDGSLLSDPQWRMSVRVPSRPWPRNPFPKGPR